MADVLLDVAIAWAFASALGVGVLGAASLLGGKARPPGAVAFGCFALVWAAQIVVANLMSSAAGAAEAARVHLLSLALLLPLPYLLVEFVAAHAPTGGRSRPWRALRAGAAVVGLGVAALLIAWPGALYGGVRAFAGDLYPAWGPAYMPLVVTPFYASFAIALVALRRIARAAPTARVADRSAWLVAGLGLFAAFAASNNLAFYATDLVVSGVHPGAIAYVALFLVLASVSAWVGGDAWLRARRAVSLEERRRERLVASALLVPLVAGAVEAVLEYFLLPGFQSVGMWRLAGVAVLAYALARWRIADLPERARRGVVTTLGVTGAAASGAAAYGIAAIAAPQTVLPLLVGSVLPAAALVPGIRLAHRLLPASRPASAGAPPLANRIDAYRAALEASLARGTVEEDERFLAALRGRFRISDEVDEVLRHIARRTVALPREQGPGAGYERLRLVGEGGEGRTWLARHEATDRLVVLKQAAARIARDPRRRAAVLERARLAEGVRHPRVVRVERVFEDAGVPLVVMEFVEGGTLAERLERGSLPPAEAVAVVDQVLDGLQAMHAHGLVHGDVKAENVLLDVEGSAKIADFGTARVAAAADVTVTIGPTGSLSGMAPEQVAGSPPTVASDVYAAAALLYRLLTGDHYVDLEKGDEAQAREAIATAAPRLPHPRVPAAVEAVLRQALAKVPATRFRDARAMREALARAGQAW